MLLFPTRTLTMLVRVLTVVRGAALLALAFTLGACAPVYTVTPVTTGTPTTGNHIQAAFSTEGAVWSDGQTACVARVPQLRPICPTWPAPTGAVAWAEDRAWVTLPTLGQVVTVDGAAQSVLAGQVAALSSTRIYREDGSALTYSGQPTTGTLGRPSSVITGGDGHDYALVAHYLISVGHETKAERAIGNWLYSTSAGAAVGEHPTVDTGRGLLELREQQLFLSGRSQAWSFSNQTVAIGQIGDKTYALVAAPSEVRTEKWQLIEVPR